ncbi:hypothetical protein ACUXGK_001013 [Micrococcus aloeverae]
MIAPHAERRPLGPGAASMKSFDGDTPTVPAPVAALAVGGASA